MYLEDEGKVALRHYISGVSLVEVPSESTTSSFGIWFGGDNYK